MHPPITKRIYYARPFFTTGIIIFAVVLSLIAITLLVTGTGSNVFELIFITLCFFAMGMLNRKPLLTFTDEALLYRIYFFGEPYRIPWSDIASVADEKMAITMKSGKVIRLPWIEFAPQNRTEIVDSIRSSCTNRPELKSTMQRFYYTFMYESPSQHEMNRVFGYDDTDGDVFLILAETEDDARAWGKELAKEYVRLLYGRDDVALDTIDFTPSIEKDAETIRRLDECSYRPVPFGERPDMHAILTEKYTMIPQIVPEGFFEAQRERTA